MALRTRHISFILHLSEVKFTTRLVIPMDIDGLCWVPSPDFRYSFASNVFYIRWKVLRTEFCLFHRKKYISYGCVLEMYGKKSISTLPNRELGKCNEIPDKNVF